MPASHSDDEAPSRYKTMGIIWEGKLVSNAVITEPKLTSFVRVVMVIFRVMLGHIFRPPTVLNLIDSPDANGVGQP